MVPKESIHRAALILLGISALSIGFTQSSCTTLPQVGSPEPQVSSLPAPQESSAPMPTHSSMPTDNTCCQKAWGLADGTKHTTRGTGYYPDSSALEGGFHDRYGKDLQTLQAYLAGKAQYVSVAMDKNLGRVKRKLCSPELNAAYGKALPLYVVDTGGAFKGKGWSRIDVCTADKKSSVAAAINRTFTVIECK